MSGLRRMAALALAGFVAAFACTGCGKEARPSPPDLPPLEGMEPAVAEKIKSAHAQVVADPSPANWGRYGRVLHVHDLLPDASNAYLAASRKAEMPERFAVLYLRGVVLQKSNPVEAIGSFEEANKLRDDYAPLHIRLGLLHEARQTWDDARSHFERAEALNQREKMRFSAALAGMGRVELARGRLPEAIALLEKARRIDPDDGQVHASLGAAYARGGRPEDAARERIAAGDLQEVRGFADPIMQAMQLEGVSYVCLRKNGQSMLKAGKPDAALLSFERALTIRSNDLEALLLKAQALILLERCQDADPLLDRVLAATPDSVTALGLKAACALSRNDHQRAIALLERARAAEPGNLDVRFNLGRALRASGDRAKAREHFRVVIEAKPWRHDVRLELAASLADDGKLSEAVAEVDLVLAQDRDNRAAKELRERWVR